jgi:hypothetical protein
MDQQSRSQRPLMPTSSSSTVAPAVLRSPWTQTRQRARSLVGSGDVEASLPPSVTSLLTPLQLPALASVSHQTTSASGDDYMLGSSDDYSSSTSSSAPSSPLLTPVSPPRAHTASIEAHGEARGKRWNLWSSELLVPLPSVREQPQGDPFAASEPSTNSRSSISRHRASSILLSTPLPPGSKPLSALVPPVASLCAVLSLSTVIIFGLITTLPNLRLPHSLSDVREQTHELRLYSESSALASWHVFGVLS